VNYAISLLISFLALGSLSTEHDFHVSKCLIEYKAEKSEIQISMNIFIDDLETALKSKGIDSLYIGTEKEALEANDYITKYLAETLTIEINEEKDIEQQFVGKELSDDLTSIWCYLQINTHDPIQSLFVKNSILLETYEDQSNITSIVGPDKQKSSFMSTRGDDEKKISY